MALLPRFLPLLCAVPPCLPTSLAGNQNARSCSSPGAQWLVLCPQAKGALEDRAPRTSEPSRSSISWQRLLRAMKAPAAAACPYPPLQSWADPDVALHSSPSSNLSLALQGDWIHPELLAALLKHPVNHFAVFKSKKCNEKKPKGLPWLCH